MPRRLRKDHSKHDAAFVARRAERRGKRRRREIQRINALHPWRVRLYYAGFHSEYDDLVRKIAGKVPHEGSGFAFFSGERDHGFMCKSYGQAREIAERFVGFPGMTRVVVEGNLIEEEVLLRSKEKRGQPREREVSHRRRHRRRRKKRRSGDPASI